MNFSIFPAVRVNLKSYTLVNLSASYDVLKFLQLYGRIDNLFDTVYEDVLGFGTPGFSGYMGFKLGI
jgi:vitamin B12 transporter